jgi:hypothetical protein
LLTVNTYTSSLPMFTSTIQREREPEQNLFKALISSSFFACQDYQVVFLSLLRFFS